MSSDPRKVIKQLNREIEGDLRSFNQELGHQLRTATPIATGRARAGWRDQFTPNSVGRSGSITLQTNRVEYIQRLDDGWSTQAPRGIVEEAVRKTRTRR